MRRPAGPLRVPHPNPLMMFGSMSSSPSQSNAPLSTTRPSVSITRFAPVVLAPRMGLAQAGRPPTLRRNRTPAPGGPTGPAEKRRASERRRRYTRSSRAGGDPHQFHMAAGGGVTAAAPTGRRRTADRGACGRPVSGGCPPQRVGPRQVKEKRVEHRLRPPLPPARDRLQRRRPRERRAVGARCSEGIVDIHEAYDLRCYGDLVPRKPVGVAGPVVALVVPADDRLQAPGELHTGKELDPPNRMHLDQVELVAGERAGLTEDLMRDPDLSKIVEVGAEPDRYL